MLTIMMPITYNDPDYIISATIYWMNPRPFTDSTSAAQIPC